MVQSTSIPGFTIRPATERDAPLILSLIRELAEYERLSHEVVATEEELRRALFGGHTVAEAIIGDYDGKPVSFALYFHTFSTFLSRSGIYLEDLYVKPEHRGRGYGGELLSFVARVAKERGCGRFEWAVLDWNDPAIRFYKKLGAVPMSEWTVYRLTGPALDELADRGPE